MFMFSLEQEKVLCFAQEICHFSREMRLKIAVFLKHFLIPDSFSYKL